MVEYYLVRINIITIKIKHERNKNYYKKYLYQFYSITTKAIRHLIVQTMRTILEQCTKFGLQISTSNKQQAERLLGISKQKMLHRTWAEGYLNGEQGLSSDIKSLWKDSAVKNCFARYAEFSLPECTE